MKFKKEIFFLLSILFLPHTNEAQDWGERVFPNAEITYDIYMKNFSYADTTFLVTDIRADSVSQTINSFNIQNLSVFRAFDGADFLPNQPVIFFVHGGGWTDGYASMHDFIALSLTGEKGWTVVNVDYRLTSDSVFVADEYCPDRFSCFDSLNRKKAAWYPDNIKDVAGAFDWTLKNISENGGDTTKIFLFGHSAGAHLVTLFSVHPSFEAIRSYIKAVVSLSGGYDIKTLNAPTFASAVDQTFHGGFSNNDEELDEASPLSYIESGSSFPPFYLLHSQFDLPSLPQQKIQFYNKLKLFDFEADEEYLLGYNHVTEIKAFNSIDSLPTQLVTDYIQRRIDILNSANDDEAGETPQKFVLFQNRPNPFGKMSLSGILSTEIKFHIPKSGYTELKIYDSLGKEVKTLIQKRVSAGYHSILFNAENLSSGVYFYQLKTGQFSETKKMVFIR